MEITIGKEKLEGDLISPKDPKGIIIFAHGSGSSHLSPRNQYVAKILNKHGFATLLFDLLTKHEELVDMAGGVFRFNISFLNDRFLQVTKWVKENKDLRDLPFGYFGASTGGACALLAATTENPFAIVIRGGRPDMVLPELSKVKSPTLLIVGSRDNIVIDLNKKAYNALNCEKRMDLIKRATHLFEEEGTLEAMTEHAVEWFSSHVPLLK